MPELRDGTNVRDIRLDRIEEYDPRNAQYPATMLVSRRELEAPRTKRWTVGFWLDQGQEGACVGFGFAHELAATPVRVPHLSNRIAREKLYWEIQKRDQYPGGAYPGASPFSEGSSVLAGARYLKDLGAYGAYHWARTEPELAAYVSAIGPAVLGLRWLDGMYDPDAQGFLRPTGQVVGGHCILCVGIDIEGGFYTLHNSWGKSWGDRGTAKVARADMAAFLAPGGGGEACCPDDRKAISFSVS